MWTLHKINVVRGKGSGRELRKETQKKTGSQLYGKHKSLRIDKIIMNKNNCTKITTPDFKVSYMILLVGGRGKHTDAHAHTHTHAHTPME